MRNHHYKQTLIPMLILALLSTGFAGPITCCANDAGPSETACCTTLPTTLATGEAGNSSRTLSENQTAKNCCETNLRDTQVTCCCADSEAHFLSSCQSNTLDCGCGCHCQTSPQQLLPPFQVEHVSRQLLQHALATWVTPKLTEQVIVQFRSSFTEIVLPEATPIPVLYCAWLK